MHVPHMSLEVVVISKGLRADMADRGACGRAVRTSMHIETAVRAVCFATLLADVGLSAGMQPHVSPEGVLVAKRFPANIARERSFSGVNFLVYV